MGKFFKNLLFSIVLLFFCLPMGAALQESLCTQPKVAVLPSEIVSEVFDRLNKQYPPQPEDVWMAQIQAKVLEELRSHSPGIAFIPASGSVPKDCDYYFKYIIWPTTAGEVIEVAGVEISEYKAFLMTSSLNSNPRCGVQSKGFTDEITRHLEDIYQTIEHNIEAYGNIKVLIDEHEDSHPVPPRGPELKISQEPEEVSPLEEETKLVIKIHVTNCKGEPVYDKFHGQIVILPRKTERGELSPTKGFPQNSNITENIIMLNLTTPEGGSVTYTLKKGIDSGLEQINIGTCGLDKNALAETEINIKGLEIKVTPQRRSLPPGEKTQIQVELNKVDQKENREPIAGKEIKIKLKGLINGNVSPVEEVLTDENGKTILTYRSGDKDKKVTIQAEYKPKDITETVKGESTINIYREAVWTGTVSYRRNYNETLEQQVPGSSTTIKTQEIVVENANFLIHGWPFSHSYDGMTGIDLYYTGVEDSLTGSYSGTYERIAILQGEEEGGVITDTAFCNGTIKDNGYLVINNEEMRAFLDIGLSWSGDEQCQGQTTISGSRGSQTMDFEWDHCLTFAGMGFLETNIATIDPKTISGTYSLPEWGITWSWNLSLTEK